MGTLRSKKVHRRAWEKDALFLEGSGERKGSTFPMTSHTLFSLPAALPCRTQAPLSEPFLSAGIDWTLEESGTPFAGLQYLWLSETLGFQIGNKRHEASLYMVLLNTLCVFIKGESWRNQISVSCALSLLTKYCYFSFFPLKKKMKIKFSRSQFLIKSFLLRIISSNSGCPARSYVCLMIDKIGNPNIKVHITKGKQQHLLKEIEADNQGA